MQRTVKLRVRVDHRTYSALREVEREYREVLEDAIAYGLQNKTTSFVRIKAGIYRVERERHRNLPSHYIYAACEDASERLDSFEKLRRRGRARAPRPAVRRVAVHLDDHLWRLGLDRVAIAAKGGWVYISPTFHKLFWRYYNGGWKVAGEARFRLLKENVVELYIVFKKDEPQPYEPRGFVPVDLNEDNVAVMVDGRPVLLETGVKRMTLGYYYRRRRMTEGRSTKARSARRALRRLRERERKLDMRWKLANLIVRAASEARYAVVLENLPKRAPEHMVRDTDDRQLRLRIYRAAFSSMKEAIVEKARERGVPVVLVNPAYTSSTCPVHWARIVYPPDGGNAPRVGRCSVGGELWHRDVAALYNLLRRAGDGRPVPLASTGTHDPPTVEAGRWLRAKSLRPTMNGHKVIEVKAQGQTARTTPAAWCQTRS